MDSAPVLVSREGAVGVLELARPEKFNALYWPVFEAMDAALTEWEAGGEVRAILIRAQGKNFCTGADLSVVGDSAKPASGPGSSTEVGHRFLQRLEASPLPVVAAVQGLCLAGGLELMMGCDIVFAAETARFGDQHAGYGLIPGWGGTARLPRLIGLRRAMDLLFTAKWVDAATAERWGLVNHVAPDAELHAQAMDYCQGLTKRSRNGLALMKRLGRQSMDIPLADAIEAEMAEIPGLLASDDVKEGMSAFLAKRAPNFR